MPNPFIKANTLLNYQNNALGQRAFIAAASDATGANSITNNVGYWDNASAFQTIFTPSAGAGIVRGVNSRDWEFFTDSVTADLKSWNIANGSSKWGIIAPTSAPGIASASGSTQPWTASTEFSTFGCIVDFNGNTEQLVGVNALGTNPSATLGTTSTGQPTWNQTSGGTTTDGTITWTNKGPIGVWKANSTFTNYINSGTVNSPAVIWDAQTNALFCTANSIGTSGAVKPPFSATPGWTYTETTGLKWFFFGVGNTNSPTNKGQLWQHSTFFPHQGSVQNNESASAIVEPCPVTKAFNPLTNSFNQTIYIQAATSTGGGTSAASFSNPAFQTSAAGTYIYDDNMIWLNLGSATWPATTTVTAWSSGSTNFNVIKDTNGNLQVCSVGGTTGGSTPTWKTQYGDTTSDGGTVKWVCIGGSQSWVASTQWFLPTNGFVAPSSTSTFQGASVVSGGNLESVVSSGKTGSSIPTFNAPGLYTAENGTGGSPYTLTQVTVSGGTTTYTGTITGGGANAYAGQNFLINGFVTAGNFNIGVTATASTATTITVNTTSQVNETHAGTAANGLIWFDVATVGAGAAGVVTLISPVGRIYYVSFLNSTKQNFSDLSPASAQTGTITNGQINIFNIPVSTDPQVDQKVVLSTADGGDPTTLYLVAQIPNLQTQLTDNIAETTLVLGNIYQQNDSAGNGIGVLGNQPPPNGSFPTLHKGRVFMIVNNQLAFSKSLADVTTTSGIIAGRFEEDWDPNNILSYSPGFEIGKGLLSDGTVLYVGTEKHIHRVIGDGDSNLSFQTPEVLFSATGLMTQNVWKIVFLEGTPTGAMWVTPDFRVLESDFNTYKDMGTPIQSTLNTINPAAINTAWAESVTLGPYNFYVLAIPTGNNTAPDTLCLFEMHLHKWFIWNFADNFTSGIFNVSLNGTPRWIMVDTNGNIRLIDTAGVQDRETDTPVNITSTIRTTWLNLGDPTTRKTLNEVELETSATNTLVTIEGASNASDFASPNIIISNLPLVTNIFGQLKTFTSGFPSIYRYYRFTFTSVSSVSSSPNDVLLGYFSAEVLPLNRI